MLHDNSSSSRVLITGVGGAAGIASMRALADSNFEVHVADADYNAPGLYSRPMAYRHVLPMGKEADFVPSLLKLCQEKSISYLLPTVDAELLPLAKARSSFERVGTEVITSGALALRHCLDKWETVRRLAGVIDVPHTRLMNELDAKRVSQHSKVVLKPRSGSGSTGIVVLEKGQPAPPEVCNESYIVQEYLPGPEYSVDVLSEVQGRVIAAVPRERIKVDSGVSVVGRTFHSAHLCELARQAAEALGVSFVTNVQFRCDAAGRPKLLEINARVPGTIALTQAAGVNMVALSVAMAAGQPHNIEGPFDSQFVERVVVRQLTEEFISTEEWRAMRAKAHGNEGVYQPRVDRAPAQSVAA